MSNSWKKCEASRYHRVRGGSGARFCRMCVGFFPLWGLPNIRSRTENHTQNLTSKPDPRNPCCSRVFCSCFRPATPTYQTPFPHSLAFTGPRWTWTCPALLMVSRSPGARQAGKRGKINFKWLHVRKYLAAPYMKVTASMLERYRINTWSLPHHTWKLPCPPARNDMLVRHLHPCATPGVL